MTPNTQPTQPIQPTSQPPIAIETRLEMAAIFTEMRESYRAMSHGHTGLGGFCIAIAQRCDATVNKLLPVTPPSPASRTAEPAPGAAQSI